MKHKIRTADPQEYERLVVERHLAGISPTNAGITSSFVAAKRLEGKRPGTLRHYAAILAGLDQHLNGRRFSDASPDDLRAYLLMRAERLNQRSLAQVAAYLKHFLRYQSADESLPVPIRRALRVSARAPPREVKPIEDHEFRVLLQAAGGLRDQALLWLLWDTGFRISEALSLRVGSFEADDRGGGRDRPHPRRGLPAENRAARRLRG